MTRRQQKFCHTPAAQRGFTLIELMVVLTIIAILASILIPNFMHARAESQTYSCEGNLRQLASAMEEYATDNSGQYPASIAALQSANSGVYLKSVPADPGGGGYAITNTAVAPCAATSNGPTYTITDGDQHDPTTGTLLPGYKSGNRGISYCSGAGLTSVP